MQMNALRNFLIVLLVLEVILGINGLVAGSSIQDSMLGFVCSMSLVLLLPTVMGLLFLRGKNTVLATAKYTFSIGVIALVIFGLFIFLGLSYWILQIMQGNPPSLDGANFF